MLNQFWAMATAIVLFLSPFPTTGMNLISEVTQKKEAFQQDTAQHDIYNGAKVNNDLMFLEDVLTKHLGTDRHKIQELKTGIERHQCKLSNMRSSYISGSSNEPLRCDLRTLLYKPWTDPYYGNHLSHKDFSLLKILKKAIYGEYAFQGKDKALLIMQDLKNFGKNQRKTQQWLNEKDIEDTVYKDLFYRRHLHELGELFKRCPFITWDGKIDFKKIPRLKIQSDEFRDNLRLTMAKAHMMHMLTAADIDRLENLRDGFRNWKDVGDTFDTYAQNRITEILDELIQSLQEYNSEETRVFHNMVAQSLSSCDFKWLREYDQNLMDTDGFSLQELVVDFKKSLISLFNRSDYLSKFQFYRDRPIWCRYHNEILKNAKEDPLKPLGLVNLFVELSQLEVSLNSLGDERDRSILCWAKNKEAMSIGGKIDWLKASLAVGELKRSMKLIQSKILEKLQSNGVVFINRLIDEFQYKEQQKEMFSKAASEKEIIWILTLDGGGVRGKIAAEILRDLSYRLQKKGTEYRLSNIFDFVGGTSVGGLIAQALNLPGEGLDPSVSEDYIANLLDHEQASVIFPLLDSRSKSCAQANSFAYEPYPFESFLLANFGFTSLDSMRKWTMVMAHDVIDQIPLGLKSYDKSGEEIKAACSARATTAAPTYFPGETLCLNEKLHSFVDGGITANNPAAYALEEFLRMRNFGREGSLKQINVLSIGTGEEVTDYKGNPDTAGLTEVIENLSNGGIKNNVTTAHKAVISRLGGCLKEEIGVNYYRLNPLLDKPIELDSATEENIAKLRTLVYESIFQNPLYEKLIAHLAGERDLDQNIYMEIKGGGKDSFEIFSTSLPYLKCMEQPQC